ncbi:MAG: class I SAM-dependent methyltransferase [Sedimentisphaerales bacterium]|nr:class I SAM-dependent methyltransferase [Sedimentisphaerales bacterium]
MHLTFRKSCRVCGSMALTRVINLGDQHLQGSFVKPGKETPPMRKIPLSLVRCDPTKDENACGLLQMEHTVPPEVLYSSYWYRSGTNTTMRNHLKGIVEEAVSILRKSGGSVLDIGCNDGTLFGFYPKNYRKFGVDPSDIAGEIDKQTATVVQDVFPSDELVTRLGEEKMDVITSIAMFYDLEDPVAFAQGIKSILAPEGIWIFEMSYMPLMLKMTSYDTICHEHLEFYSLAVIEYILKKSGMKIFNATLNDINGGSLRCFATHVTNYKYKNEQYHNNIRELHKSEFDLELDTDKPYKNFQDRVNVHRDELSALLKRLKDEGKKIHIYGASTKGNTILQWCDIDNRIIDYAAERSPEKYGARTLGTDIPIISEAESRKMNPDYYLVLPWHFKKEFIERERETLERGTRFIFPLPKIEIISKEGVSTQ